MWSTTKMASTAWWISRPEKYITFDGCHVKCPDSFKLREHRVDFGLDRILFGEID